jgi:hypothetical protein
MKKIILILILCSLKIQAQERIAQQPCSSINKVTENFSQREPAEQWRKASYDISSTSDIADKNSVTFVSGNSITLTNGFHASAGALFTSYIGDCSQDTPDTTQSDKLSASPNPSSNIVNLSIGHDQITRVVLVAMDGKTVFDKMVSNENDYRLNISGYPKGVYLLAVETSTGDKHTEKIIVQ